MTRYLVTGGAGFIGSNIVDELLRQGKTVRVADNFATGKRENLASSLDKIELLEGSLVDLDFARYAVQDVDYVMHQAAIPSVPRSVADPLTNNDAGINATLNLLVAAKDAGVKRMTFASSSSVYGEAVRDQDTNAIVAKKEDMMPQPMSPYGVSKLAAEQYCMAFYQVYGFEAVALRYFNVFGARQDPKSDYAAVIPKFITKMQAGERPTIFGDGEQTRDFTYIANVIDANLTALEHPNAPGQVFNASMGRQTSLNELVDMINEILGTDIKPIYADPRAGDIKHSYASVSKAEDLMDFKSKIDLLEGLALTANYYEAA